MAIGAFVEDIPVTRAGAARVPKLYDLQALRQVIDTFSRKPLTHSVCGSGRPATWCRPIESSQTASLVTKVTIRPKHALNDNDG